MWVFEMGFVWKVTQNLNLAPLSLGTFDCVQILGSHFNNVAFFITCNVASAYVLKKKTFRQFQLIIWLFKWAQFFRKALFLYFFLILIESREKALR